MAGNRQEQHRGQTDTLPKLIEWKDMPNSLDDKTTITSTISAYCDGGDLEHFLQTNGVIPTALIWHLLESSLSILHFLHYQCKPGIAHNDFHKRNIFLHWNGADKLPEFLLGDFGCAQTLLFHEDLHQSAGDSWVKLCTDYGFLCDMMHSIIRQQMKLGATIPDALWSLLGKTRTATESKECCSGWQGCYELSRQKVETLLDAVRTTSKDCITAYREYGDPVCRDYLKVSNKPDLAVCEGHMMMLHPQPLGPWMVVEVDPKTFDVLDVRRKIDEGFSHDNRRKFEQSRRLRIVRGAGAW